MQEEQIEDDAFRADAPQTRAAREASTIQFPYGDLEDAINFARAVHEVGGQGCLVEQLAGYLKVAPNGGAFRFRVSHPRIFGFVETDRGNITLTDLGRRVVDPSQEAAARVEAFLRVPLYKAVYEKYKGYVLPPPAALEREMGNLGVSSKQTDKARQVFDRSAKQAGFYWAGPDRLTMPVLSKQKSDTQPIEDAPASMLLPTDQPKPTGGGGGGSDDLHPFIQGLLKTLPKPESEWPIAERAKWLNTASSIFGLIYKGEGSVEFRVFTGKEQTPG